MNDADIEMAELQAGADLESHLCKNGICTHGRLQGPPGPKSKPTNVCTCLHCGKTWPTTEEAHEERQEILNEHR